jgi:hypothetical protein
VYIPCLPTAYRLALQSPVRATTGIPGPFPQGLILKYDFCETRHCFR